MQTRNGQPASHSEYIGHSVFDRNGYFMGNVVSVDERAPNQVAFVIAPPGASPNTGEVLLDSRLLQRVDPKQREIHTDFDYTELLSPEDQTFKLLEEKLVINRQRVKLGEVVIRKVTETRMVEIPVQRERLVVQKQGEDVPLAEVPLGETHLNLAEGLTPGMTHHEESVARGQLRTLQDAIRCLVVLARNGNGGCQRIRAMLMLNPRDRPSGEMARMEFESPTTAAHVLSAIAPSWSSVCREVVLELVVEDEAAQARYQRWFDEYSRAVRQD